MHSVYEVPRLSAPCQCTAGTSGGTSGGTPTRYSSQGRHIKCHDKASMGVGNPGIMALLGRRGETYHIGVNTLHVLPQALGEGVLARLFAQHRGQHPRMLLLQAPPLGATCRRQRHRLQHLLVRIGLIAAHQGDNWLIRTCEPSARAWSACNGYRRAS